MTSAVSAKAAPVPVYLLYPGAIGLGAVAALGLQPQGWWWATLAALGFAFFLSGRIQSPRSGGLLWWCFGIGYFAVGLRWLVEPFQVDAEIYAWMAPFALAGMAGGLALFWALAGWAALRILPGRGRAAALVVTLALAELGRATLFTGFPWAGFAQVWIDTPAAQALAVVGPQGLGLVTLVIAACLGALRVLPMAVGAGLCAALMWVQWTGYGVAVSAEASTVRVVQPNAPQHEKWDPDKAAIFFRRQVEATRAPAENGGRPALIVWPETAIPQLLHRAQETLAIVGAAAQGSPLIFGIQRVDGFAYYNSLVLLDTNGAVDQVYDKHHLVPFGEYMPLPALFRSLGVAALAARADAGYAAGPGPQALTIPGLGAALPLICYEAIFASYSRSVSPDRRLLVQITNDAWFGDYAGPQQHLAQARMRAIEQGLPMVRAANTGISAIIDARGQVIAAIPLGQHGFIDAPLPIAFAPTLYARSGDTPVAIVLMLALAGLFAARLVAIND